MRESVLHELYFGNISPCERERIHTRAYRVLTEKIETMEKDFKNLLSPEAYEKFQNIQTAQAQAGTMEELDLFEYAFCTGALLMMDILGYKGT